jgi:DNA-binding NtrC family response regulator
MANEKVLLVDDETEFVEVLSQRLESRGMEVDTAAGGPEALERVKGKSYDAIFLDLRMPGMDGMETLRRLLAASPGLQVILLTAYGTLPTAIEAIRVGAVDFLEKPVEIGRLTEKIREAKANKMLLVEKQAQKKIQGILETKWW